MASQKTYSNADKLVAVVETWAKPLVSQLPSPYSVLAPIIGPLASEYIRRIPDESVPKMANAVIDNAVEQGSIKIWNLTLDFNDLSELQRLIKINIPYEEEKPGYEVKIK